MTDQTNPEPMTDSQAAALLAPLEAKARALRAAADAKLRAAVLREAADALTAKACQLSEQAEEKMRRDLEDQAQVWHEAAAAVRRLINRPSRMADETAATEAHACDSCEGVDPDTCFNNPHRPPEQCPRSEFEDYGQQCQKPAGHNLCTFEEQPAAGTRRMADETATTETRAAVPGETDEERADREETERDHARGDHTHCGLTCEVELPTEHLRNFVIAKGYPGTKGALTELERRAAAKAAPDADLPARLEAALTERYTELGNPFSEMRRQEKGPDGWPASHPVGPHHVAETLRELIAAGARQDGAQP